MSATRLLRGRLICACGVLTLLILNCYTPYAVDEFISESIVFSAYEMLSEKMHL